MPEVLERERTMIKYDVTVERVTRKQLNKDALKEQLQFIAAAAKRNRVANWSVSIPTKLLKVVENGEGENREVKYTAVIQVFKNRYNSAEAVKRRWAKTLDVMKRAANRKGWTLISDEALMAREDGGYDVVNGAGEPTGDDAPRILSKMERKIVANVSGVDLPPLTDEVLAKYFHRIYDREAHIRIIYDQMRLAVRTGFKTRHHILLHGKPACAKTELFLAFIDWLGDGLIEPIDASTMTKAGLETMLLNASQDGVLKPILLIEEIEKCAPENLSCLVQVMDARGKIQRTNAKAGNVYGDARIIIWGTCNNDELLQKVHSGAIWSRFSQRLECKRPDRTLMEKILLRECAEIDGNPAWVDPVLKLCYDELPSIKKFQSEFDDPRFARSLLAGGDRLLDNGKEGFLADFRKVNGIS